MGELGRKLGEALGASSVIEPKSKMLLEEREAKIILPYAVSETFSNFATIKIAALMEAVEADYIKPAGSPRRSNLGAAPLIPNFRKPRFPPAGFFIYTVTN